MKRKKNIKKWLIFFFFILLIFYSKNKEIKIKNKFTKQINNIKVCICTLGKNENRYIREFIEYYENYDIDQIFLYDNNDENGEKFEEIIKDYIDNGFVKILNFRGKKREQLNIINHCYLNNYKKYD